MLSFAKDADVCRRVQLERHFGLAESSGACGACDACTGTDEWLAENAVPRATRAPERESPAASAGAGFERGDWVRVDGRHLGHVVRVEGEGSGVRLVVESAGDFKRRTINPRRSRVERVDR